MIKHLRTNLILFLIFCLAASPLCNQAWAKNYEWQKEIDLKEGTIIGKEDLVKVKPGTSIKLSNIKSRLAVKGRLYIQGEKRNPVTIMIPNLINDYSRTTIGARTILESNENIKELEILPYHVDTKEALDELKAFRYQYAFVWTVLMGICFYLVVNRGTYW